ncbi:MAG: hypothetical protein SGPRY_000081 [Prymnesium sp.]
MGVAVHDVNGRPISTPEQLEKLKEMLNLERASLAEQELSLLGGTNRSNEQLKRVQHSGRESQIEETKVRNTYDTYPW